MLLWLLHQLLGSSVPPCMQLGESKLVADLQLPLLLLHLHDPLALLLWLHTSCTFTGEGGLFGCKLDFPHASRLALCWQDRNALLHVELVQRSSGHPVQLCRDLPASDRVDVAAASSAAVERSVPAFVLMHAAPVTHSQLQSEHTADCCVPDSLSLQLTAGIRCADVCVHLPDLYVHHMLDPLHATREPHWT